MKLHLILGDQLNRQISSLNDINPNRDLVLMAEVWEEATYVKHHKKKIAFIFSAMRHFAQELRNQGLQVRYVALDHHENTGSIESEVERVLKQQDISKIVITMPGEYRLLENFKTWERVFGVPVEILPDTRFLCQPSEFERWANGKKQLRMEFFYREMRKRYNVLTEGDKPVGGKWNFDSDNRKVPDETLPIPETFHSVPDQITEDVINLVEERFPDHFGNLSPFHFAITRDQALIALDQFIAERLSRFGDYQDAMIEGEPWLYHSHLSFYLNCGLLLPMECIRAAERAYYEGQAPLNAVEGFIRQILGWREYVRGIYCLMMPEYETENYLQAKRPLPDFFWTAKTNMNCLRQSITETRDNTYAHHIQRLMVLGNFALIAGIDPDEVNDWFMRVYADAYQWVELPNVTGMILFADGGLLASKPYAASGVYINKMSNYCKNCRYKMSKKNGPDACPFNYLYWDFLIRNDDKLRKNTRLGMSYRTLDRMTDEKRTAIAEDSKRLFHRMDRDELV